MAPLDQRESSADEELAFTSLPPLIRLTLGAAIGPPDVPRLDSGRLAMLV